MKLIVVFSLLTCLFVNISPLSIFSDERKSSRRRRETSYDDVYVEQFDSIAQDATSTNVVFAVAKKPGYTLIPASETCTILKNTAVKCLFDDGNTSPDKGGKNDSESSFPLWIIYVMAVVLILVVILVFVYRRRRRASKV